MFVNYDCVAFGLRLKALRKRCGLSQLDVSTRTGMNSDTLRRIENGSVIPKFESLEVLSDLYKVNLIHILDQCKISNRLMCYYEKLDHILLKSDTVALESLIEQFHSETPSQSSQLNPRESKLFSRFLKALKLGFSQEHNDKEVSSQLLWELLTESNSKLSLTQLDIQQISNFEEKVLLFYGVLCAEIHRLEDSTAILEFLRKKSQAHKHLSHSEKSLYIKTLINLAYNYHLSDQHQQAYQTASEGIAFCLEHDLLYGLYLLYYRCGIAAHHLDCADNSYFDKAFGLLKAQNLNHLIDHYQTVLKDLYHIQFTRDA